MIVVILTTSRPLVNRVLGGDSPLWFGDGKALLTLVLSPNRESHWTRLELESGEFVRLAQNRGDPRFKTHWRVRALAPDGATLFLGAYANRPDGVSLLDRIVAIDFATDRYRNVVALRGSDQTLPQAGQHFAIAVSPDVRTLAILSVEPDTRVAHLWMVGVDGQGYQELTPPFFIRDTQLEVDPPPMLFVPHAKVDLPTPCDAVDLVAWRTSDLQD